MKQLTMRRLQCCDFPVYMRKTCSYNGVLNSLRLLYKSYTNCLHSSLPLPVVIYPCISWVGLLVNPFTQLIPPNTSALTNLMVTRYTQPTTTSPPSEKVNLVRDKADKGHTVWLIVIFAAHGSQGIRLDKEESVLVSQSVTEHCHT